MEIQGNTILITGGGSGIGRALAHRFHDLGNTVIVAGRDAGRLAETIAEREHMHALTFDQTDAVDVARFATHLIAEFPALNIVFNNAGIMRLGSVAEKRDLGDAWDMIAANLLGPIGLIDALVDHLSAMSNAAIVNVTSGLAFVPRPSAAVCSATKAAMHSYTQSLRLQLDGKVEIIELAPPLVRTGLTPGQTENPHAYALEEFADEVMALFKQQPTPREILVQRVHRQRFAERDGTVDEVLGMLAKL